jgi:ferrous iron transport protein A
LSQTENRTLGQRLNLRLVDMGAGERGTVFKILGGIGLKRRLEAMGIRPGATIVKIVGSPLGGPVVIRIGTMRLAIGRGMAAQVMVDVEEAGTS